MDELQPSSGDTLYTNAKLKGNYAAGFLTSDEKGNIESKNPSTGDIVLSHGGMIAGNANNLGKESTVIRCKGGEGEAEIKCVGINAEPNKDYSLVVPEKLM